MGIETVARIRRDIITKKKLLIGLIASGVLFLVYAPVIQNGFLSNWDDQWMVLENPYLTEFSLSNVVSIFSEPYGGQYSPLNTIMYLSIKELFGLKAAAFHLNSVLIHLVNFVLVGLFLYKMLGMIKGISLPAPKRVKIAWITALLFAIHPMQVESVAWISASKVLLYSFFYLLGLFIYLFYRSTEKRRYLVLTLCCFLCSLLAKEQSVVFILSLVAIDLVSLDKINSKKIWLEKIPFLILAVLFSVFTLWLQSIGLGGPNSYPFYQRFVFANYSFWEYLIKLFIPYELSHFYFFPMDVGEAMPLRLWFYPVATGVLGWLLFEYREHVNRLYLFGGLFFLINLFLVLHLIPIARFAIIADRYIYLSSIGFFLVITYMISQWLDSVNGKKKKTGLLVICAYVVLIAGYTHQRTQVWKNMETLNRDVKQAVEKHMGDMDYLRKLQELSD